MKLPPTAKPIFKSKTAIAAALTSIAGALGFGSDAVSNFLSNNASAILLVLGGVHIALRKVTKGKVTLFGE